MAPISPQHLVPDVSDTLLERHAYFFRAPGEGDSRGPCPALNTLANHGYLPRNGCDISSQDLLAALCNPETYNISGPLAYFLVYGGHVLMHHFKASSICLHELARHGCIEHDASVVHKDTAKGRTFAPSRCDTIMLKDLLDEATLTLDKVAQRRAVLEKGSPLGRVHQELARGEWALVLDIFGRENGGEIPSEFMEEWLKENRFPEGWRPTHQQDFLATILKANEIQQKMNEYQKHLM